MQSMGNWFYAKGCLRLAWETAREDINVYSQGSIDRWVYSSCNLCSNGCGCFSAVKDNKIVGIKGNVHYPINCGRLGPKGENQWYANRSIDRLTAPLIRNSSGVLVLETWDDAMGLIVDRMQNILRQQWARWRRILSHRSSLFGRILYNCQNCPRRHPYPQCRCQYPIMYGDCAVGSNRNIRFRRSPLLSRGHRSDRGRRLYWTQCQRNEYSGLRTNARSEETKRNQNHRDRPSKSDERTDGRSVIAAKKRNQCRCTERNHSSPNPESLDWWTIYSQSHKRLTNWHWTYGTQYPSNRCLKAPPAKSKK